MAPDQIWPIGLAMPLPGDVRRRAVDRLEHRRKLALGVDVGRRRHADGAGDAGPRSDRMSPNRLEPTTTSKLPVAHEMRRQNVDVVLVDADIRIGRAIALKRSSQ